MGWRSDMMVVVARVGRPVRDRASGQFYEVFGKRCCIVQHTLRDLCRFLNPASSPSP